MEQKIKPIKEVQVGDIIFSYANTKIEFIGVAKSIAKESYKPSEFGNTGDNWDNKGWKVDVDFSYKLTPAFKPKEHINKLVNLLPLKYSPIRKNGHGNQGCYLAKLSNDLGIELIRLCNANDLLDINENEPIIEDINKIISSKEISETQKKQLIDARIGQGNFRKEVLNLYPECPVSKIKINCVLRASHIKPWKDSNNEERLDAYNGIMLAAHIDALFDKGYISFTDKGTLIISTNIIDELEHIGIDINKQIKIHEKSKPYLKWHRENVLKK